MNHLDRKSLQEFKIRTEGLCSSGFPEGSTQMGNFPPDRVEKHSLTTHDYSWAPRGGKWRRRQADHFVRCSQERRGQFQGWRWCSLIMWGSHWECLFQREGRGKKARGGGSESSSAGDSDSLKVRAAIWVLYRPPQGVPAWQVLTAAFFLSPPLCTLWAILKHMPEMLSSSYLCIFSLSGGGGGGVQGRDILVILQGSAFFGFFQDTWCKACACAKPLWLSDSLQSRGL